MPRYRVTINYVSASGQAKTWSGERNAASPEVACASAADQIRARQSVTSITGGFAQEVK